MDQWQRYQVLSKHVVTAREGLAMARQNLSEFERNQSISSVMGNIALAAQATILPLNIIINAFPGAGKAKSIYEKFARVLYERFGASGTRVEGKTADLLGELKRVLEAELTRKKMVDYVPVVRIFTGLAEDGMLLMQTAEMMERESTGTRELRNRLQRDIQKYRLDLARLSQQRIQLLERAEIRAHTV
ncbi:MAG TPA: hypothetical protein VJ952_08730 [Opitutales bacterium]|nr:hypothetical protein [Opitutales bacterium]